jgi:hypothetical protein
MSTPRKLGKREAKPDDRVPSLARLSQKRETPPVESNWYAAVGHWPMFLNDELGDCVPAGAAHQLQQRSTYAGNPIELSNNEVVDVYRRWGGYDGTPQTDQGCYMSEAMNLWLNEGIPLPGGGVDKIEAYATVQHQSSLWLRRAIWRTGGVLIGLSLPERWLNDVDYLFRLEQGDLDNIAGGHCVFLCGYLPTSYGIQYDVITWGQRFRMTEDALLAVTDEAYCVLNNDWLNAQNVDPAGVSWDLAVSAMNVLKLG